MIPFDEMTKVQSQFFDFGDQRLNHRAFKCLSVLMRSQAWEGFPGIFADQYALKAFYRLMNNRRVNPAKISEGYALGLQAILKEQSPSASEAPKVYYQYQDTTYGSYRHRNKLDLGYLENPTDNGVVIHTAILTDSLFTPIGLPRQKQILRKREDYQKAQHRKARPLEEKESYKWIEAMHWSTEVQKELNATLDVPFNAKTDPFEILSKILIHDTSRNKLILDDVVRELEEGNKVVIITERREHLFALNQFLKRSYETITLSGADLESIRKSKWKMIQAGNFQAVLTTGQFFGEGIDLQN